MSRLIAQAPALAAKLIQDAKPGFNTFLKYAKVELTPPTVGELPEVKNGLLRLANSARTGKWKQLTVREAWLNTLVAVEVWCWFFVGECIGKRHIVGYDV